MRAKLNTARERAKNTLMRFKCFRLLWTRYRAEQLHREYAKRRDHYAAEAANRGLVYDKTALAGLAQERFRRAGYNVPAAASGPDTHVCLHPDICLA